MKSIQKLIEREGGIEALKKESFYIKLVPESKSFMPLVIEYVGKGPKDLPLISIAHYYEQNGDAMRDPEMVFIVNTSWKPFWHFTPMMYQQDNLGIYQEIIFKDGDKWKVRKGDLAGAESFARLWDKNIKDQGYLELPNTIKKESQGVV